MTQKHSLPLRLLYGSCKIDIRLLPAMLEVAKATTLVAASVACAYTLGLNADIIAVNSCRGTMVFLYSACALGSFQVIHQQAIFVSPLSAWHDLAQQASTVVDPMIERGELLTCRCARH